MGCNNRCPNGTAQPGQFLVPNSLWCTSCQEGYVLVNRTCELDSDRDTIADSQDACPHDATVRIKRVINRSLDLSTDASHTLCRDASGDSYTINLDSTKAYKITLDTTSDDIPLPTLRARPAHSTTNSVIAEQSVLLPAHSGGHIVTLTTSYARPMRYSINITVDANPRLPLNQKITTQSRSASTEYWILKTNTERLCAYFLRLPNNASVLWVQIGTVTEVFIPNSPKCTSSNGSFCLSGSNGAYYNKLLLRDGDSTLNEGGMLYLSDSANTYNTLKDGVCIKSSG